MAEFHNDGTGAGRASNNGAGEHFASDGASSTATNYVDFNQFVQQLNLGTAPQVFHGQQPPVAGPGDNFANMFANAGAAPAAADMPSTYYPPAGAYGNNYGAGAAAASTGSQALFDLVEVVRKSNLMATATEFVPLNYAPLPLATEFVPTQTSNEIAIVPPVKPAVMQSFTDSPPSVNDGATLPNQIPAITLDASQGAIRKTYTNNNSIGGHNGGNSGRGQNNNAQQRPSQDCRVTNTQRSNHRQQQQQTNGSSEPPATNWQTDANDVERNNWRDQRRQTGGTGGGSGRTQSQYNDNDRAYGYDTAAAMRRADGQQQLHEQQPRRNNQPDDRNSNGGGGGRNQRTTANPFNRRTANAAQAMPPLSTRAYSGASNSNYQPTGNGKPSPFASQRNERDRDRDRDYRDHRDQQHYQRDQHHNNSRRDRDQSHPNPARPIESSASSSDANTTAGDPLSPAKKPDKKKHPEFKANRNLSKPVSDEAYTAADRLTGECSQREKLIREIDAGRLECLVCCENIKPFQSTWCCGNCFHIIHLNCITKWANSSADATGWRCPACQHVTKAVPDAYVCFCGRTRNPQYNRNDVAHSCGELCGKLGACPHACTLLCHPGPCATCHAMVERRCGCGKTRRTQQCCQKEDVPCQLVCDKVLGCGVHRCTLPCHAGDCAACTDEVEHRCHCGKDKRQMPCERDNNECTRYSCQKLCNRQLACRAHKCKRVCHADECGDCQLLPAAVTSCPCGKQAVPAGARKACTDPVPLCEALCGRPLKCGQPAQPHQCASRCHQGACPVCPRETAVRCRCGGMEQLVKCRTLQTRSDDARCKKRCTKKRNCGKHKCNQECCIDIDHVCPLPCTFQLSCGKHKCDQTCHKGRCQRCYRSSFVELFCECGAQVIYPPVPCGSKRPVCDRPCSRQHACAHPVAHNCHGQAQCPPCMAFVAIRCYGGHEERKTIPCSQGEFSCGLKCGKGLRCGRHRCVRTCHDGECEKATDVCKQSCQKVRVICGHRCVAACHEGECPDVACREQVEVLCQCGHRKGQRTCQEFANEYRRIATAKMASTMESMQHGGMVELADVLGPIKMSNNKTLECNEECKMLERNRRLALGLQIRNPDTSAKYAPKYTEFAKGWARKDPQLVGSIYDKLTELVKLAKQSQQKSRSHSFPTMNWEKRQLVHELCKAFGIESVAYDAEPNRNVVATATRDTSWLPSMSLMEVLKRESGQRRIPVPMNNAWGMKR